MHYRYANRPAHGLANTGEYLDGLGNKVYVYAIGNPAECLHSSQQYKNLDRYQRADVDASGFAIVRIDCRERTYNCESYRFLADLSKDARPTETNQFPGWPLTIRQTDNYGRKPFGYLPEVAINGVKDAVVKVYIQQTDELLYALRLRGNHMTPWGVRRRGLHSQDRRPGHRYLEYRPRPQTAIAGEQCGRCS